MDELLQQEINNLERKIKLLIAEHRKLTQEVLHYRTENELLHKKLTDHHRQIVSFQNNNKITKLVENMVADGENSAELKDVLEYYITEIDRCIALLGETE